ncbi:hypothetical protein F4818DRAFT_418914 [Hypoxylon cercidicola]|nr:hypothetical protein F4818DRAFT_418914 [Hypoxylon cercidicola]
MAEPVGITGTAVGILSLGLQLYGGLKEYLDNLKDRDEYIGKNLLYLNRLRSLTDAVKSDISASQNNRYALSQEVVQSLGAYEAEINIFDARIREYEHVATTKPTGQFKETIKKLGFPFARPELEKLASRLERANNLLSIALQGLNLQVLSVNQGELMSGLSTVHDKVNEIQSREFMLETNVKNSHDTITTISQDVQRLSLMGPKIQSSISQVSQVQHDAFSTMALLHADNHLQQQSTTKIEESINELKDMVARTYHNGPQGVFQMLMSKPDYLRSYLDQTGTRPRSSNRSIDSAQGLSQIAFRHWRTHVANGCMCRRRRRINHQSSRWSTFTRFNETTADIYHEPGCLRYRNGETKETRTVGIVYTGLHRLLNIAVVASYTMSTGAGGASISPMFRYYAMVDDLQSPAFRIVHIIGNGVAYLCWTLSGAEAETACQQVIQLGKFKLQQIFDRRASVPTDVNVYGMTLVEACLEPLIRDIKIFGGTQEVEMAYKAVASLSELDIPTMKNALHDSNNSILYSYFINPYNRDIQYEAMLQKLVLSLIQGVPGAYIYNVRWNELLPSQTLFVEEDIAEAFGLDNSLFAAVLAKDENTLVQVLRTASTSPEDFISNGISVLHLAILWPIGLRILLDSLQGTYLAMECDNLTLLEFALQSSFLICEDPDRRCRNCPGAESVKILLDAGCPVTSACLDSPMTNNALYTLLGHIKTWRERLMILAQTQFLGVELEQLGLLNSSVLDHSAPEVIRKLEAKGISVFTELGVEPGDYRLSPPSSHNESSSIYHDVTYHEDISTIVFDLGFRDIDTYYEGRTPIMNCYNDVEYGEWLLDHGASATNLVPWKTPAGFLGLQELPRWTVAHHLMVTTAWNTSFDFRIDVTLSKSVGIFRLATRFSDLQVGDGCDCGCSDVGKGCVPLTTFFNSALLLLGENTPSSHTLIAEICKLVEALELEGHLSLVAADTIIRVITFNALEIRHTCCATLDTRGRIGFIPRSYGEDFLEIQKEDKSLLDELEKLIVVFNGQFREQFHGQGQSIFHFVEGYWKERMDQVLQEKEARRLTREEREAAAQIGVILSERLEEDEISEESESESKSRPRFTAEYWIDEMNCIYK